MRSDAAVLEALSTVLPGDSKVPFLLAEGLLRRRKAGHWTTTSTNSAAIVALARHTEATQPQTPDCTASAWLSKGRSTFCTFGQVEFKEVTADVVELGPQTLNLSSGGDALSDGLRVTISAQGQGTVFYNVHLSYLRTSVVGEASEDHGFKLHRTYSTNADSDRVAGANITARCGEVVLVSLKLCVSTTRYHVALVDRLPAGFEPLQGQGFEDTSGDPAGGRGTLPVSHVNYRDSCVEAFISVLRPGLYMFRHTLRAVTVGNFQAPPASVEEMYNPAASGLSSTASASILPSTSKAAVNKG